VTDRAFDNKIVDPCFLALFQKKYHIVDTILLLDYDDQFPALQKHLELYKTESFTSQDRIIVAHFDTDYYIHNQFGLNLINLFNVWEAVDIPLHVMLLYTNHFGIQHEIDLLCRNQHLANRPTLVQTFIDPVNYRSSTYDVEPSLDIEEISYHGMAMMSRARSHRFALYNHLAHLDDKLALVIKANP